MYRTITTLIKKGCKKITKMCPEVSLWRQKLFNTHVFSRDLIDLPELCKMAKRKYGRPKGFSVTEHFYNLEPTSFKIRGMLEESTSPPLIS